MARLIPREVKFFDMFVEIASNVTDGARELSDLLNNYDYEKMPAAVARITDIEHRGDEMTHKILIKLNQTFITPFDREDIHLLASSLDDVLDFIFSAADRLVTYKITHPSPSAKVLAGIILKQAEELAKALTLLGKDGQRLCSTASRSTAWRTKPTRSAAKPSDASSTASPIPSRSSSSKSCSKSWKKPATRPKTWPTC